MVGDQWQRRSLKGGWYFQEYRRGQRVLARSWLPSAAVAGVFIRKSAGRRVPFTKALRAESCGGIQVHGRPRNTQRSVQDTEAQE